MECAYPSAVQWLVAYVAVERRKFQVFCTVVGPPLRRAALRRCLCCSSGAALVETAVGASWLMAVLGRVPSGSREGPQGSEHVKIFVS